VTYKFNDPYEDPEGAFKFAQIAVGAATTAAARTILHTAIQDSFERGETLLYCDTDSMMLLRDLDDPLQTGPELGDGLGELTSEVSEGWHISSMVAVSPKNYGYVLFHPATGALKQVVKVKGLNLREQWLNLSPQAPHKVVTIAAMKQLMGHHIKTLKRDKALALGGPVEEVEEKEPAVKRRLLTAARIFTVRQGNAVHIAHGPKSYGLPPLAKRLIDLDNCTDRLWPTVPFGARGTGAMDPVALWQRWHV
jgi:hypothetical protein